MKTIELLTLVNGDERKYFVKSLQNHKRKNLGRLFSAIEKGKGKPDKETLFKAIFGKKYTKDKDYLLRNELRLLNNEIENFIIDTNTSSTNEITEKRGLHILKRICESGNEHLFESYFSNLLNSADAKHDYETISELYALKGTFIMRHKEISLSNYKTLRTDLLNEQTALLSYLEEKLSENRLRQHFTLRVLRQLGEKNEQKESDILIQSAAPVRLIIEYNNLIADSYLQKGIEKKNTLLKALNLYPEVVKIRPTKQAENSKIYGNIAIELFLNQQHESAHEYYQKALALMNESNISIELLFNYCINALTIGQHSIFIETYKRFAPQITENNKLKFRFQYFTAMAYLFENQPKKAFEFLDHEISKRPETEYYFYRMVYAMVYFQLGDFDFANRELENILQSFRKRKPSEQYDKMLVKIMQRLILATINRNNKQQFQTEREKLRQQTEEAAGEISNFSQTIYRWIRIRLEEIL